ncbi:putative mitochondrial protein AtMg00860 [Nicotiana tabacum]|uniref:Mitochondrial protein AtMg00860 n=1 Tax=Nicotiana tabacum TaxID=4097 RepID=A0AC58RVC5_TOBAC
MTLAMLGLSRMEWRGTLENVPSNVVSFLKAQQMAEKGCLGYLDFVGDFSADTPTIESVSILREKKLYAKFSNCEFFLHSVAFLVHLVSCEGIKDYLKKIEALQSWPRHSTATEIWSFLGLARYFCHFMKCFSSIAAPLVRLTQKGALFMWYDERVESFQKLNITLTTTPVLVFPLALGSYTFYCDASWIDIGCVFMQVGRMIAYALH